MNACQLLLSMATCLAVAAHRDGVRYLLRVDYTNVHPTERVTVADQSADIDSELAAVIEVTWRLGLRTWTCCQDAGETNADWVEDLPHMASIVAAQRGWAYIDFPMLDGVRFLTALAQAGPRDAFYLRMNHWAAPNAWHVSAAPQDIALRDETLESRFEYDLLMVRFPNYDRIEILNRLTAFAAGYRVPPGPIDRSSMGG